MCQTLRTRFAGLHFLSTPHMSHTHQFKSTDKLTIVQFFITDLRQSRQSLSMQSERMSSRMAPHHVPAPHSVMPQQNRRSRPRSRSRDHNRPSSRYSTAGSTHTLNNYCDNSDNWTDHDMEIYMARNPTTRNGLVPL